MTDTIDDDPFRWLEEVEGPDALAWVRERNTETVATLAAGPRFTQRREEIREILDSEERIPLVGWHGRHLYNLWRDAAHPRGLWRRATLDEYRRREPDWQVLIDLDALAAAEGERWVWQDVKMLRPAGDRCLVSLSPGGSDASVVREFDLSSVAFVPDGFALPAAKSSVGWIDVDRIYVGTDFGPGTLTTSGYPRVVKEWQRGTPLSAASVVFEGSEQDVSVYARHDPTPGFGRDFVGRSLDFFRRERYLRTADGTMVRIEVPEDAELDARREWLLVRLRSAWTVGGVEYPAGALLAADFDAFLAGERCMTPLFEPDPTTSLRYHSWTRNHLVLSLLSDVRSRQEVLTPGPDGWRRTPFAPDGLPEHVHTEVLDTNPDHSDEFLLLSSGYVQPATLSYGNVGGEVETLRQEPAFFDADGVSVRQCFATSADGTRIPYFVAGPAEPDGGPTLLTGYGGFEVCRVPYYNGIIGRGWLSRGGTYVVANIRGGGEYGPRWHHAALRENRPRAYEDFAAVATDLVRRGIAVRPRLGIDGGSNGGLLVGVMLTRYPELFDAVVCQVPLLDMRRYHRMLAGASWMAEYGDPDNPADWAYLREFSPYHNVHSGCTYPPVLFGTSTRDDRVHPGHARKMMARLCEHGYDVSYYENIEGGHGAAADNAQLAFKSALVLEFLWRRLAPDSREATDAAAG
jgi:prolyl oligopeptidase